MKSVALTIIIFVQAMCIPAWALVDNTAMAPTLLMAHHTILGGVIKSVSWTDPAMSTKFEIIIEEVIKPAKDHNWEYDFQKKNKISISPPKKTTHVLITPTTTLWDADAKAIMPDKIIPKKRVNVIYLTNDEGINIAKSIKLLK